MQTASTGECPPAENLLFGSMGDVRRASAKFFEDAGGVEPRKILDSYRRFRLSCIRTSLALLKASSLPDRVLVSARLKRLESVYRKMRRNPDNPIGISEMDDVIGFRVVCESLDDAVALGERIESRVPARTKNYIEAGHPAGLDYRAIHGIVKFRQPLGEGHVTVRFEIQVRTWYQHLWACWCESYGEQAKEGFTNRMRGDPDVVESLKRNLIGRSREIARWEEAHPGEMQTRLPSFIGLFNLAVVWVDPPDGYGFRPCPDIDTAVRNLRYLELQRSVRPLLLVGVADKPGLEELLKRTHPNFVGGRPLEPRYWMPEAC